MQEERIRPKLSRLSLTFAGVAIAIICALPLADRIFRGGAHNGLVWGRFAERRAILAAFVPYVLALWAFRRVGSTSRRRIIGFAGIFYALLIVIPSVGSRDIYSYLFYGRMFAHGHLNPLVHVPNAMRSDQWIHLVGWRFTSSVYGPIWTFISAGASATWPHVWPATFFLKILTVAGTFAGSFFAAELIGGEKRNRTLLACLWNPLVIFSIAGDGHVDGVLVALVLGALLARKRDRMLASTLLLVIASLIKLYCGLFLALHLIGLILEHRRSIRSIAGHIASALGITAVAYSPLWAGRATFTGLARVGGFFSAGFPDVIRSRVRAILVARHAVNADMLSANIARWSSLALFAFAVVFLIVRARKMNDTAHLWAMAFGAYLLAATWFVPWHAILLVFLAMAYTPTKRTNLARGALALSATASFAVPWIRFGIPIAATFIPTGRSRD